ncbi:hypothetical protein DXG01_016170 [Tephrocybe rancida]|nr:hypothetical protein DXG01_016170 [Tephrocybe rancida]
MANTFRTDRVRLLILIKKKEDITKEEFSDYWRNVHAKLFMNLDIGHTDSKYATVFETDTGLLTSDYDGVLMLDGESFEKLFEVICLDLTVSSGTNLGFQIFRSDEFRRNVGPDEENFVDRPKCLLLPVGLVTFTE